MFDISVAGLYSWIESGNVSGAPRIRRRPRLRRLARERARRAYALAATRTRQARLAAAQGGAVKCVRWKALERGSLRGFADIAMDSGLVLLGCTLHTSNGRTWVNPPSRAQLTSSRELVIEGGKVAYAPVIEFVDPKIRFKWSDAAVAAIADFQSKAPAEASAMNGRDSSGGQPKESPGW